MCYIRPMLKSTALAAVLFLSSLSVAQDSPTSRPLPTRRECRTKALASAWGKTLARIPSTVVDIGVLRNIPYFSFRAGEYELNLTYARELIAAYRKTVATTVAALTSELKSQDHIARTRAAFILSKLGAAARPALADLRRLLVEKDPERRVRPAALIALDEILAADDS